jgi:tetratricopeptide (TPR) repeat protein
MTRRNTQTGRWSGWIALACGLTLGLASTFTRAAADKPLKVPSPSLVRQTQEIQSTVASLDDLRSRSVRLRSQANQLVQSGTQTEAAWQRYLGDQQKTVAALRRAEECLPSLQKSMDAIEGHTDALRQAIEASHEAVRQLAGTDASALAAAAAQSNQAFARRTAAEQAFEDLQSHLRKLSFECANRVRRAQWDLRNEQTRALDAVDQARALVLQHQALLAAGQASLEQFTQVAQQLPPGLALAPLPAWTAQHPAQVRALGQALSALGWTDRSSQSRLTASGPLTPSRLNLARLFSELARLEDATAYIDLNSASPAADCTPSCVDFSAERRDLALRTIEARQHLTRAIADWQQAAPALASQLPPIASVRQGTATAMESVGALVHPAVEESTRTGPTLEKFAGQLLALAEAAHEQARSRWQAAHLAAYGSLPATEVVPAPTPPAAVTLGNNGAAMAAMQGGLRSHAYDLFREFDGEIQGFGAYTYVLVRSAADLEEPSVKIRFQRLLTTLQKLPRATLVPRDQARQVNVFCIPVTPYGDQASPSRAVPYSSELGHQIKLRAQNGLLTQQAVHHRLTTSPGPFLLTLPTRLSQATTDAPVLLADLSSYPEDAVEDLATHYMNGLVDDFPRQQALWKPPVLQRVALFMIYLAQGTGQMVTSALPTAQAEPR